MFDVYLLEWRNINLSEMIQRIQQLCAGVHGTFRHSLLLIESKPVHSIYPSGRVGNSMEGQVHCNHSAHCD